MPSIRSQELPDLVPLLSYAKASDHLHGSNVIFDPLRIGWGKSLCSISIYIDKSNESRKTGARSQEPTTSR